MAKLMLSTEGLMLKEITLDKERMSIGRKPHNDIQIENLAISGEHALIVSILGDSFLEDLDSTNGTFVNGQRVKKHVLRHRDVIEIGKYRLKYLVDGEIDEDDLLAVQQETQPLPPAAIRLLQANGAGKTLDLVKAQTTLGKPGVQVAAIVRRSQGYFLSHVEGAQPPSVNGQPLTGRAHCLADHDQFQVAGINMEFFFKASSGSTPG